NRVTIGPLGSVLSDISAREIVVMGTVKGNLTCSERVDIRNGSSVTGEVVYRRLTIEDGAMIKGSVEVWAREETDTIVSAKVEPEALNLRKESSAGNHRFRKGASDQSASQFEGSSVLLSVK